MPGPNWVALLSKHLDFPAEFFYADEPPILSDEVFRSSSRIRASDRYMVVAAGCMAIELDQWIEEFFERPVPNVPDLRDLDPETAAEALRATWALGYQPIRNLVHTLEANGVRIYSLAHDTPTVDAFSAWFEDTPYIFLNTMKTAERSRFDAAHELGHLVLHAHAPEMKRDSEKEAHRFAAAFLMPKPQFLALAPRKVTLSAVLSAKAVWGVSALAYVHRLHHLKVISDWHYRQMCIQIKTHYGHAEEPGPPMARETSQVLAKVMAGLRTANTSRPQLAARLRINPKDLDEITFGLVLTPISGGQSATSTPREFPRGDRPALHVM